jgi:hypothetical protein
MIKFPNNILGIDDYNHAHSLVSGKKEKESWGFKREIPSLFPKPSTMDCMNTPCFDDS